MSDSDALHAIRGLRSIMHGFVDIERSGGFGLPLDLDESYKRLVTVFIRGFRRKEEIDSTVDLERRAEGNEKTHGQGADTLDGVFDDDNMNDGGLPVAASRGMDLGGKGWVWDRKADTNASFGARNGVCGVAETIIAALQVRDGSTWAARVLGVFATRMDLEKADELLNQVVNHPSPEGMFF